MNEPPQNALKPTASLRHTKASKFHRVVLTSLRILFDALVVCEFGAQTGRCRYNIIECTYCTLVPKVPYTSQYNNTL